ncbi:glycosyltransferase [Chitinimonas sp.]|uniref:glycosyltransferase n=1 Tax=Chitinimonas sp. TaxID=1934313 RepID=UPI0035B4D1CC
MQEQELMPYHAIECLADGPALVLAPHPDDEVFGCGGAIAAHRAAGHDVTVVLITDGAPTDDAAERQALADTRLAESTEAARILGCDAPICWHWRDRAVEYGERLIGQIAAQIKASGARIVYAPSLFEFHPDHRAVALAAVEAVRRMGGELLLAQYEVGAQFRPSHLLDISAHRQRKAEAMQAFTSQLAQQRYDQHVSALNQLRTYTLDASVEAAEGYIVLSGEQLQNDLYQAFGPYRPAAVLDGTVVLPSQQPLVSVLLPQLGDDVLAHTLADLSLQSYRHIEVLVAGAANCALPSAGEHLQLGHVTVPEPCSQADAANRLLQAAKGDWLMYLADGQRLAPDHIARLLQAALQQPDSAGCYAGARLIDSEATLASFNEAVSADELWLRHPLPLRSLLFSARAAAKCAFDQRFDAAPWRDFTIQLLQHGQLQFVEGISASFCAGTADHTDDQELLLQKWLAPRADALAIVARTQAEDAKRHALLARPQRPGTLDQALAALTGEMQHLHALVSAKDVHIDNLQAQAARIDSDTQRLSTLLDSSHTLLAEREQRLADQQSTIAALQAALDSATALSKLQQRDMNGSLSRQRSELASLQSRYQEATAELADLRSQHHDTQVHVRNLEHIVHRLQADLDAMTRSRSWQLTRPLRAVINRLRAVKRMLGLARRASARAGGWTRLAGKVYRIARLEGMAGIRRRLAPMPASHEELALPPGDASEETLYERWIRDYDQPGPIELKAFQQEMAGWSSPPLISILMPVFNTPDIWLSRAIDSVLAQHYPHWELCIADDASTQPHVASLLARYASQDSRIKVIHRSDNGHISAASNSALASASGDYIALLDHDDELPAHALFLFAREIIAHPDADVLYSDEDKIGEDGRRFDPHFKPDWNPDLFLAYNFISHLGVYRHSLIKEIGGFRQGFEGAQDYDLALRAIERTTPARIRHIPHIAYHWRVIPGSTAAGHGEKPYAYYAAKRAIEEHLSRSGMQAEVDEATPGSGYFRVRRALPKPAPAVTIIIPTRDGFDLLSKCIDSITEKTTYPDYRILVIDNGSTDPRVLNYLSDKAAAGRLTVLRDERPFNYSALNNAAVKLADTPLLCFMNNDIEVISPDWLDELVSHAQRPEVGIVGCKLLYPNNTNQHGGVILGVGGVAGHAHHALPREAPGYFSRNQVCQNYSAVTAACSLVRKAIFDEVGGFNEQALAVAFNDVDLCLKVQAAGYFNVWTPFALLYHHESASRGFEDTPEKQARFAKEIDYMLQSWADILQADPAYNPNLSLVNQDYVLAFPPRRLPHTAPTITTSG